MAHLLTKHREFFITLVISILIIAYIAILLPKEVAICQSNTRLFVDPQLIEKRYSDVGTTFQVNLTIDEIMDLQGLDLNVTWDSSLLSVTTVEFESLLNSVWGSGNWYSVKNETGLGYYKIVAVSIAASFNSHGPTPLCRLEFTIQDPQSDFPRQTQIHFATHKLSDHLSDPIGHTASDGTYTIEGRSPTIQVDPNLTTMKSRNIGNTFKVNITIRNVHDLFGFDFNITWDPTLLTLNNSRYQNTLDSVWGAGKWYLAKNENGSGCYKLVALSTADSFNTTQSQTFFDLELRVENPSQSANTSLHFAVHKLSNTQAEPIAHTVEDGVYSFTMTPTLSWATAGTVCRKIDETFTASVNIVDAENTTDFEFEIRYNTTLLGYVSITWKAWTTGTIQVNESEGLIEGSTSGLPLAGTQQLVTLEFKTTCHQVWKISPFWTNNLTDTIFIKSANLSYLTSPDLRYERGGADQINIGPDFNFTFAPIPGDVNNDGTVDVLDLRTVAIYHMVKQGDPNWTEASTYDLNGDEIIDILDLRTTASNFGYTYVP